MTNEILPPSDCGWMPIANCPRKHGKRVYLWCATHKRSFTGCWINQRGCPDGSGQWESQESDFDNHNFTHWKP